MRFNVQVTLKRAIKFTKLTVFLTCAWPPRKRLFLFKIFMCFSVFLSIALLLPLIVSIIQHSDNFFIIIKSVIFICGIVNYVAKVITVRIYHEELQELRSIVDKFVDKANDQEKIVMQKLIDKCWKFQFFMTCSYYLTTTAILIGPLVLPQKFPTDAVYPFSVDNPVISRIVYLHQCFVGYQCSAGMALDCQAALFIWFLSAKFELLGAESKSVVNHDQLCHFVEKHQDLLIFADKLILPTRIMAFSTVSVTKIGMIFGGIFLISNEPLAVKVQFGIMVMSTTANIYVCSWAADYLITVSSSTLSEEIFGSSWKHEPKVRKMWSIVLLRSQKPVVINIPGLLNNLSNEYYAAVSLFSITYNIKIRLTINN
ncbi:GSCOCT00002936001.3-RA-CDS [Cotesia congregata]|uniref:Odorant receptor n=1 Tax=Cotesia congregata TaxID=51543 RepID=A0A8J2HK46_COTCN|nr:GSCOCT00002936001.3-RA-CDS [Cotesia congregata]CAG5098048.1 olfactory receptor 61 [Cotesia congregata]